MNMKLLAAGLALVTGAGYAVISHSQARPDVLVQQRQAAMILMGKYHYGQLNAMARGKIPFDAKVAARNAVFLEALSKMPWDGFHPSTKGIKSEALPAVFTDSARFNQLAERMQAEVAKLVAVTKTGDEAAVKAQIGAVHKACGVCHEDFREQR